MHYAQVRGFFQDALRLGQQEGRRDDEGSLFCMQGKKRGATLHANLQYVLPKHSIEFEPGLPRMTSS